MVVFSLFQVSESLKGIGIVLGSVLTKMLCLSEPRIAEIKYEVGKVLYAPKIPNIAFSTQYTVECIYSCDNITDLWLDDTP